MIIHYKIGAIKPHTHFVDIEMYVKEINADALEICIPVWRPGRYEKGMFAKNVKSLSIKNSHGAPITYKKTDHSSWYIDTSNTESITITYKYFAFQPDAGACYSGTDILYVNPIHCCMYINGFLHLPVTLSLAINPDWKVVTSLNQQGKNYCADNYDELVDSPVLCAPQIATWKYECNNIAFYIHSWGTHTLNESQVIKDFKLFTQLQLDVMQHFPVSAYHFILLALPHTFYHGVEHTKSTVLALGPAQNIHLPELYNELVGVASHELFHVWNIKTLRPAQMLPYKYDQENFADTGYVYEGFTTYYGDLFLLRCGYFNLEQYFREVSDRLNKHMLNPGRINYSVRESSYDTWLDGYVAGVPGRKTSIYDEGSLIALLIDLLIIKNTKATKSLDDVMRILYNDFALKGVGYKHQDILHVCRSLGGEDINYLFKEIIDKPVSYYEYLLKVLTDFEITIVEYPASNMIEACYGAKLVAHPVGYKVVQVIEDSPADKAGLAAEDIISSITNKATAVVHPFEKISDRAQAETLVMQVANLMQGPVTKELIPDSNFYFSRYELKAGSNMNDNKLTNFLFSTRSAS
ncbi:MAG: M61 family metallopeptidase [Bacteroidetes bacterium]|nr:M61 family metallopeptidase [Bacteroidota bacterium]